MERRGIATRWTGARVYPSTSAPARRCVASRDKELIVQIVWTIEGRRLRFDYFEEPASSAQREKSTLLKALGEEKTNADARTSLGKLKL